MEFTKRKLGSCDFCGGKEQSFSSCDRPRIVDICESCVREMAKTLSEEPAKAIYESVKETQINFNSRMEALEAKIRQIEKE